MRDRDDLEAIWKVPVENDERESPEIEASGSEPAGQSATRRFGKFSYCVASRNRPVATDSQRAGLKTRHYRHGPKFKAASSSAAASDSVPTVASTAPDVARYEQRFDDLAAIARSLLN